jgi:hypothetical protein
MSFYSVMYARWWRIKHLIWFDPYPGCSIPRMLRPQDAPSPGCSVPRMLRPQDAPSPGCSIPRMLHPRMLHPQDAPSPGQCVPWTMYPQDDASHCRRTIRTRFFSPNVWFCRATEPEPHYNCSNWLKTAYVKMLAKSAYFSTICVRDVLLRTKSYAGTVI